uniref:Uncharacterized protein AlNc14C23G2331 n=1 Tax=Albugo laibachii Nc14 TaxID=890382 RepID=F0W627_9STRA|nr:conserved hypothetical protein [Albugo laibachii Nc14]|eukprot:CCA16569.1 conserved hypothetical protein [Albugo laibachii Nc14]
MVASDLHILEFAASDKWLAGFMARFGLSMRRTTNLTVLDDEELTYGAVRYMAFLGYLKPSENLSRAMLMDKTAVYFENSKRQTVDITGARHVVLRLSGLGSMRMTVVLAVSALGKKLTPLIIWKGANQGSKIQKISTWIDMMFPTVLDHGKGKFLVWDSMRAHIFKATKAKCEEKGVGMCVIPGGLTSYLQAGDIGIYSYFKEKLSSFIKAWKSSDQVDYTRGGNPRPPTIEIVSSWVTLAWKGVPDTMVQNSVAAAGFSDEPTKWHIARHDVYGDLFRMNWLDRERRDFDPLLLSQSLIDTIDDSTIEDYR